MSIGAALLQIASFLALVLACGLYIVDEHAAAAYWMATAAYTRVVAAEGAKK